MYVIMYDVSYDKYNFDKCHPKVTENVLLPWSIYLLIYFKIKKVVILYCKDHNHHYFYID